MYIYMSGGLLIYYYMYTLYSYTVNVGWLPEPDRDGATEEPFYLC